jgi:hypothetical protein
MGQLNAVLPGLGNLGNLGGKSKGIRVPKGQQIMSVAARKRIAAALSVHNARNGWQPAGTSEGKSGYLRPSGVAISPAVIIFPIGTAASKMFAGDGSNCPKMIRLTKLW